MNDLQMENSDQVTERRFVISGSTINGSRGNVMGPRLTMVGRRGQRVTHLRHNSARLQGNISSTTCHVVYAFLVTTLIGLLQVKYQNKNSSPFETHPTTMRTFIITMWTYSLATAGKSVPKKYGAHCCYKILDHVSIISGALSSVSLAALFLPSSLNSPIMFITSTVLFAIVARFLYQTVCQWFYKKVAEAVAQVLEILTTRFMGQGLMEQQRVLV